MLKNEYYIDGDVILHAIAGRASFDIIHLETMMKVDVFSIKKRPYDREAFQRKTTDILGIGEDGDTFYFSSPEDIILNKLEWFKMGGEVSERQWKDTIGVFQVQGDSLDYDYLKHWAEELCITDLLQ